MKQFKRFLACILILVLSCCFAFSSYAEVHSPQPRWAELNTFVSTFERYSGLFTNAKVCMSAACNRPDSKITMTVTIQKWENGAYRNTNHTWTKTEQAATEICHTINLPQGNYVAVVTMDIYSSSGAYIETVTHTSNELII